MKDRNYILTDETIEVDGHTLHRIKCVKAFGGVKERELGGFVESEANLFGDAWVYDEAKVFGGARVYGDAWVSDDALVYGDARVSGSARVFGNAQVYGNAQVSDNAQVFGNAQVYGNAQVSGNAQVFDNARIYGDAWVCGEACVECNAEIYDYARVGNNARVSDDALVYGSVLIKGNADISNLGDYIVFKNWWSSGRFFTWTRSNNMWAVGCFYGTGKELIEKAYKDSEVSGREYEKIVKYVDEIKSQDNE